MKKFYDQYGIKTVSPEEKQEEKETFIQEYLEICKERIEIKEKSIQTELEKQLCSLDKEQFINNYLSECTPFLTGGLHFEIAKVCNLPEAQEAFSGHEEYCSSLENQLRSGDSPLKTQENPERWKSFTPSFLEQHCDREGAETIYAERYEMVALKPVIYLYPEKSQEVRVQLDYQGKLIVDYPDYDEKIG